MDVYNTGVLNEELLHCDNLEDLKKEILPKLLEQRSAWKQKIEQIMQENHYSAKELAKLCKVSVTSVRKWYKGTLPQSRDMFLRIGFAANYNLKEMNSFLQRYGHYPKLYVKSLEDSVCIFILCSKTMPHTYQAYSDLLERMHVEIGGEECETEAHYSTQEMAEGLWNVYDEEAMSEFVYEHASEYKNAYAKLYNYIQAFLQLNRTSRVDASQMSIQELAESQNWSSSLRHCISEIRSGRWFPMRHKLISLGLHLNMDLEEINQMLRLAQMEELCAKNPVEAVLIYALEDARLNDMIFCDGTDVLCDYVKNVFEQLQLEEAEYIVDDL